MVLITIFLSITTGLFLMSKVGMDLLIYSNWQLISQYISLIGTVSLSLSFVLASRARFLEKIFGGLDKVIKMHHIVGGIAFVLILHHPLFLALSVLPNFNLARQYLFLSTDYIYNFGVLALYLMALLLILTLVIKLPYHIWIKTHDFLGMVLLLACLHIFFITSDVSRYLPLRIWMFVNLGMGIFFYIYKVFLYKNFGPKYGYTVEKVNQLGTVVEIYLRPDNESIKYKPGQFAFVKFEQEGITEIHPFSFSSSPDDVYLRFSVKILGDYTSRLRQLVLGTKVAVWGAYGQFYYGFKGKKDVVCIAGGIGITPFVSLLRYETKHILPRKISLFYSAKNESSAVYHSDLTEWESTLNNFSYFPNFDEAKPRLSSQSIIDQLGNWQNKIFYICGPTAMIHSISAQLKENGVKPNNIIFEDFNFK